MQKSYKDALCGIQNNSVIIKKSPKKKRYQGKCKFYYYDNGCWKGDKKCKYYHEPLFHFENPITVFQCNEYHYNSEIINENYLITTNNGDKFTISHKK